MTKRTIFRVLNLFGILVAVVAAVPTLARFLEPTRGTPIPQLAAFGPWTLPLWLVAGCCCCSGGSAAPQAPSWR